MAKSPLHVIRAFVKEDKQTRVVLVDGSSLEGAIYLFDQQSSSIVLCSARSKNTISDLRLIPISSIREIGSSTGGDVYFVDFKHGHKVNPSKSSFAAKKSSASVSKHSVSRSDVVPRSISPPALEVVPLDGPAPTVSIPKDVRATLPPPSNNHLVATKAAHKKSNSTSTSTSRRGSRADTSTSVNSTRDSSSSSAGPAKEPGTAHVTKSANATKTGKRIPVDTATPARRGSPLEISKNEVWDAIGQGAAPAIVDSKEGPKSQTTRPRDSLKDHPKSKTMKNNKMPKQTPVLASAQSPSAQSHSQNSSPPPLPPLSEEGKALLQGLSKHLRVRQQDQSLIITTTTSELTLDPPYTSIEGAGDSVDKVRRILNSERSVMPKKQNKRRINVKVPIMGG